MPVLGVNREKKDSHFETFISPSPVFDNTRPDNQTTDSLTCRHDRHARDKGSSDQGRTQSPVCRHTCLVRAYKRTHAHPDDGSIRETPCFVSRHRLLAATSAGGAWP